MTDIANDQNDEFQEEVDCNNEQIKADKLLDFGSKQIISLFVPVSVCMLIVGVAAKNIGYYKQTKMYLFYTPFHTEDADAATTVWQSLANAMIFIIFVAIMTVLLVLLYKYKCYKFIHGYLMFATILILFFMFGLFFLVIAIQIAVYVDYVTLALFVWNVGVVGFLTIHWRGPLILQQGYLIVISAKLSLILLKYLPQWTAWVLLGVLVIWDLIAVLCPFGPLRILVNIAQERDEPIFPALIYSTTATIMVAEPSGKDTEETQSESTNQHQNSSGNQGGEEGANNATLQEVRVNNTPSDRNLEETNVNNGRTTARLQVRVNSSSDRNNEETVVINDSASSRLRRNISERGERGVKLGLGDFVFYSLLMGRATLDSDPATILACYVAILVGMFLTILLLAVAGRALPALPISMACGILFYFVTSLIISPFTRALSLTRIFI